VFAILASLIIASQVVLFGLLGVQLVGLFIAAITITYRLRALIPIYVYVLLYCIVFPTVWSIPYLYIWLPLWAVFMLVSKIRLPQKAKVPIYMVLCGLYGLSFGLLYAPFQMVIMSWNFDMIKRWWIAGFFTADLAHAVNNFALGILIVPLSKLLSRLDRKSFL
jgi:hypothetical protein